MHKLLVYLFISSLLFSCSSEPEKNTIEVTPPQSTGIEFSNFNEKISYCIGFDQGYGVTQVYNGENTKGKFILKKIEEGLLDYLGDAEQLRINISSVDSVLNLYLGENGMVDESFVSKADASYAIGIIEAQTLVASLVGRGIDQNMEIQYLLQGITEGMYNIQNTLPLSTIRSEVSQYFLEQNKKMGASFLAQNKQNENVITTESGLQYEVIQTGTGIIPNLTDSCVIHYTGRFIDGRVFESTIPSGIPASIIPMGVIVGWQEGLRLMKEGGSTRFFIPSNLAYGESGNGAIEPFSTLVFDIDLIRVKRFQP